MMAEALASHSTWLRFTTREGSAGGVRLKSEENLERPVRAVSFCTFVRARLATMAHARALSLSLSRRVDVTLFGRLPAASSPFGLTRGLCCSGETHKEYVNIVSRSSVEAEHMTGSSKMSKGRRHASCHHSPLRVASSRSCVSTAARGSCTYLTTEPLMNMFLTASCGEECRDNKARTRNEIEHPRSPTRAHEQPCIRGRTSRALLTRCGYLSGCCTVMLSSLIFRNLTQDGRRRGAGGERRCETTHCMDHHQTPSPPTADVLIHALEGPTDGQVVLEFHRHFLACERLEDAEDELGKGGRSRSQTVCTMPVYSSSFHFYPPY